jgi:hypothetical protein
MGDDEHLTSDSDFLNSSLQDQGDVHPTDVVRHFDMTLLAPAYLSSSVCFKSPMLGLMYLKHPCLNTRNVHMS